MPERTETAHLTPEQLVERLLSPALDDLGHPTQTFFKKDEEAEVGAYRLAWFWTLQMLTTRHPLREKMALFWHDHFAVSDAVVEDGSLMWDYLLRLRANPLGKFGDVLQSMAQCPALLRMLDVDMIFRDTPNENFARELLELYTLGEGNYTEADIREIARAFTGWSYQVIFWRMEGDSNQKLRRILKSGTPAASFALLPDVHDPSEKTILGIKKKWTGNEVVVALAKHPKTAEYICKKLWSFFGGEVAKPAVLAAMTRAWANSDGEIKEVLRAMATHPDFYAPDVVGRLIKSPIEFLVGMTRSFNGAKEVKGLIEPQLPPDQPMPQKLVDQLGAINYFSMMAGQNLLYPPDVAGWNWHSAWINTQTVFQRKRFRGLMMWEPYKDAEGKEQWRPGPPLVWLRDEMRLRKLESPNAVIEAFEEIADCPLNESSRAALAQSWEKNQGMEAIKHDGWFAGMLSGLIDAAFFSPEYQVH